MSEVFKDIKGFEGCYKISNFGRVLSLKREVFNGKGMKEIGGIILKQALNHKGYPIVYLSKDAKQKTLSVHRLVAKAFVENKYNKPQVNHIDGVKQNNLSTNLEWCTNSENQLHAYRLGLSYVTGRAGRPKRPVVKIDIITGKYLKEYPSIAEASREIKASNIGECCRGKRKYSCGYKWEYVEQKRNEKNI